MAAIAILALVIALSAAGFAAIRMMLRYPVKPPKPGTRRANTFIADLGRDTLKRDAENREPKGPADA